MKTKVNKLIEQQTRKMCDSEIKELDVKFRRSSPDRIFAFKKECEEKLIEDFENAVDFHSFDLAIKLRNSIPSVIEELFILAFECGNKINSFESEIKLCYQPEIKCQSGKTYYPDFSFVFVVNHGIKYDNLKLLIELDGHIWHEKNPDQVERDKIRERELIDNGYTILRFSGREVYRNPFKVVQECTSKYFRLVENAYQLERAANG